jgi:serine protease inhibitor
MTFLARIANVGWKSRWDILILLLTSLCTSALAQKPSQIQPAAFLHANDKFALDLLRVTWKDQPDRNIVLAPLPVSLTFAALSYGTTDYESEKEFAAAFHWQDPFHINVPGRMLLARFVKPQPRVIPKVVGQLVGPSEELWLSAAFLYRGEGSLSQDFIDRVKNDFAFEFRAVDEFAAQTDILAKNWDLSLPMPTIKRPNDFWITSSTHLRTSWAGNTFLNAKREKSDFTLRSGNVISAQFLKTEFTVYRHAQTETFEAAALSGLNASIVLVLPVSGKDVAELEAPLTKDPNLIELLLREQEGDVKIPPFHFFFETDLKSSLEKMGVRRIFSDPYTLFSMAPKRDGGVLRGVAQKTEISVDENGIRADAGTIFSGVYGGIFQGEPQFHMVLNHPFLFIIRDNATNALLFIGVVMNPNLQ